MPLKLRKPRNEFESFDWLMAEVIADLPSDMASSLLSLPAEQQREKMKKRVVALARQKGIKLDEDDGN